MFLDASALPLVHEWALRARFDRIHWDPVQVLPVLVIAAGVTADVAAATAVRSEDEPGGIRTLEARSCLVRAHHHLSSATVWTVQAAHALGVHAHTPQILSPVARRS